MILIIEDDLGTATLLRTIAEALGHQAVVADNGNLGLKLFREYRPALVITDIYMPGKDGIETITEIRADRAEVPIIAISAGGVLKDSTMLRVAQFLGATEIIEKPIKPTEFASTIEQALHG